MDGVAGHDDEAFLAAYYHNAAADDLAAMTREEARRVAFDHRRVGHAIDRSRAVLAPRHHAVPVHQAEVARDVALARARLRDDLADRFLAEAQRVHDLQACRLGEHAEVARHRAEHRVELPHPMNYMRTYAYAQSYKR